MEVRRGRVAGVADEPEDLAARHLLALGDPDGTRRQVGDRGVDAVGPGHDDVVAGESCEAVVRAERQAGADDPGEGRRDEEALRFGDAIQARHDDAVEWRVDRSAVAVHVTERHAEEGRADLPARV
jgi:hypothetical protein